MTAQISDAIHPHSKLELLRWYAIHFPRFRDQHTLVRLAANPERVIPDFNERLIAAILILEKGIQYDDEIKPLLDLVKDENDFPIKTGDRDSRENNALLRSDAALALANYGFKSVEFIKALTDILDYMTNDPLFVSEKKQKLSTYFNNFLDALKIADIESAYRFTKITEDYTN